MSLESFLDTIGPEIDDPEEGIVKSSLSNSWLNEVTRVVSALFSVNTVSESGIRRLKSHIIGFVDRWQGPRNPSVANDIVIKSRWRDYGSW